MKKSMLVASTICIAIFSIAITGMSFLQPHPGHGPRHSNGSTPDGYTGWLVYMANGITDPNPLITGQDAIDQFFVDIMGRSEAEIERHRQQAVNFYQRRFGIDAETSPDVTYFPFMLPAEMNYQAYVISGVRVPNEGFAVRDGGWMLVVTNPNGITLGGEFAGQHVPAGAAILFGDYNIDIGRHCDPIIIRYRAGSPVVGDLTGELHFICELNSDRWGIGLAQGTSSPRGLPDGSVVQNTRNILTFSHMGGL